MKRHGILIYNSDTDRMDIRFGLEDYYGGFIVVHLWKYS